MAVNHIQILEDVINSVAHTITITSVDSLGGSEYKLNTENTLYLRTDKKVTIDSVEYKVTDFSINSFITVKALSGDVPVTVDSFDINPPLFIWGNPKMVSIELLKRKKNGTVIWPYIWVVQTSNTENTLDPAAAVKSTPTFNMLFLDSADKNNWTIRDHYDNDIYVTNNYIEFFKEILKSRRDIFATDLITYSTTDLVNFGDYIVDKGMEELIINGEISGMQVVMNIPYILDTCNDFSVEPKCNPVTILLNGVFDQFKQQGTTFDCITGGGSVIYDIFIDGVDTGQDLDFDGTNHIINIS